MLPKSDKQVYDKNLNKRRKEKRKRFDWGTERKSLSALKSAPISEDTKKEIEDWAKAERRRSNRVRLIVIAMLAIISTLVYLIFFR